MALRSKSGDSEFSGLKGRKNATVPDSGILADFQPADPAGDEHPRPPSRPVLRTARVSDLGFVVSALQAGRGMDYEKAE